MIERYELFLERELTHTVKALRGKKQTAVIDFLDLLSTDPFIDTGISFEDGKGRILQETTLVGLLITVHVDHALREIKIIQVRRVV